MKNMKDIAKNTFEKFTPGLTRILTNIGWLTIEKILQMGINIFVGIWLARFLGPEKFGIYSYALAFVALFGSFASFGLQGIVVRDVVRNPDHKDVILGSTFILKLIGAGLAFTIIAVSIIFTRPGDWLTISLVIILAVQLPFRAFNTIDLWFQSKVKAKNIVYVNSSTVILGASAKLILIFMQAPLPMFAAVLSAEAFLTALGLIFVYRIDGHSIFKWRPRLTVSKELIKQSWLLLLSGIGAILYLKIDQLMLGEMVNSTEVGIYSAAVKLSESWYFIPTFVAASVFPAMIKSKDLSKDLYETRLQQLLDCMSWLALFVAIPISFSASYIISILFGDDYVNAGPILAIHIWACIFIFFGEVLSKWLINEGLLIFSPIRHGTGAIVNILLNFWLIPFYGGVGAAVATLISYAFASYLACFFYPKTRPAGVMMTFALFVPIRTALKVLTYWKQWRLLNNSKKFEPNSR